MAPTVKTSLRLGGSLVLLAAAGWGLWHFLLAPDGEPATRLHPDDPELVALGQTLYGQHCASCHGARLEGQPDWRRRRADGKLPAPPHDVTGHTWHHPDELLFKLTKLGPAALAGSDYRSDMPAYGDILSDRDIVAVLSYIKSNWPVEVRVRHDQINQADR